MQKNSNNFSIQDIMQLANSPAGQQLISILRKTDPVAMQSAMASASKGDYAQAKQLLEPFLAADEVQRLLKQLGG